MAYKQNEKKKSMYIRSLLIIDSINTAIYIHFVYRNVQTVCRIESNL